MDQNQTTTNEAATKKKLTIPQIVAIGIVVLLVAALIIPPVAEKAQDYKKADALYQQGEYDQAAEIFGQLGSYKDSVIRADVCRDEEMRRQEEERLQQLTDRYAEAEKYLAEGLKHKAVVIFRELGDFQDASARAEEIRTSMIQKNVVCTDSHTVGIKDDGKLVAVGSNYHKQCNLSGWTDIVAISVGAGQTVGLKADGTVVATAITNQDDNYDQCDVEEWTDIVAISAGSYHTVGLKADGTVVATGDNKYGQCEVFGWTDIIAISAGDTHTVGLKADGTVVATAYIGDYYHGQCDVEDWTDIVAISAGSCTVGVKADGSVVAAYNVYAYGQEKVTDWKLAIPEE